MWLRSQYWIYNPFFSQLSIIYLWKTLRSTLTSVDCNLLNSNFVLAQTLLLGNLSFFQMKIWRYQTQLLIIYYRLRDLMKPCFKQYFVATDLIQVINIFSIWIN